MKNLLPKKSKKGITLVETVIAVVVLAILAIGVLSLMSAGGRKILLLSNEASDQAAAVQQMDLIVAAISNGDNGATATYIVKKTTDEVEYCYLKLDELLDTLDIDETKVTLTASIELYDDETAKFTDVDGNRYYSVTDIRGWYLVLTYKDVSVKGVTVEAFVSNSEGVFDK